MEMNDQFYSMTNLPTRKVTLGGPQSLSGQFEEKEGLLPLPELNHNFSFI
jgi:hypothetical protein